MEKKWFEKLGKNKSISIAKKSVKHHLPNSIIYNTRIDENDNITAFVRFEAGKSDSSNFVFTEYDIKEAHTPIIESTFRQYLMECLPTTDRVEYLYDAMEYLALDHEAYKYEDLAKAKVQLEKKLDEIDASEYDILAYKEDKVRKKRQQYINEYKLARKCVISDFDDSIYDIAQDLSFSYASSFNPKTIDQQDKLIKEAMDILVGNPEKIENENERN